MKTIELLETGARDFFSGSDGAYYTPVAGVEARCGWCGRWGHVVGLYHRQILYTRRVGFVCDRHVVRWGE